MDTYNLIREYVDRRLRHRLVRPTEDHGRGFERFTEEYLHDTLGLYRIPRRRADLPGAKV
jgi:RNA-directed DNA polymerase